MALAERAAGRLLGVSAWAATLTVCASFGAILAHVAFHGAARIDWTFLSTAPRNAGRDGGILPLIVSTTLILGVAMGVAMPLGLATALLLAEPTRRGAGSFRGLVRRSLDVLAGVPSIVFGLFGNAFFCKWLGLGFSILSGGLTLAVMVLPILIRMSEEGLRLVPSEYRTGAAALGLSRLATFWHVLLPAAAPSVVAGTMLGIGRAVAETAALIFTSGYVDRMPSSLMDSGRSLSIHIYDLSMNVTGGDSTAYATSLVLVALLVLINFGTAWVMRRGLGGKIARG